MARCLAVAAIVIWFLLLSPYPTSVFIAAVTAALTLPIYRWLRARMSKTSAIVFFSTGLVVCVATPITIVLVMVIPQALEGARRLSAWWQAGHAIPPAISYYLGEAHRIFVENVPNAPEYLDKLESDFNAVVNAVLKNVLSRGLNLAGDTMGMVWALCLFMVFTCLIVVYAPSIRRAVLQVLPRHEDMVERFVAVLHNASRSVFISIVFVPIIQGTLTGIGLRFLDVPDPAFWGLLAVFTAGGKNSFQSAAKFRRGELRRRAQRHGKIVRTHKNAVHALKGGYFLDMFQRTRRFALRHEQGATVHGLKIAGQILQFRRKTVFGAAGKGEAPFAHGEVLGIAHQVAHFLHRTHIGNDDAPRTQIQGMEHRRAGAVAHAHEGFRAVQLQGAYHFPCAFFGKGAVLRVDDHIVKAGKAETFRHDGTAEMAEGADHALPGVQLLIKGAHYFPLFSSTSRMSETASLRLSMELA